MKGKSKCDIETAPLTFSFNLGCQLKLSVLRKSVILFTTSLPYCSLGLLLVKLTGLSMGVAVLLLYLPEVTVDAQLPVIGCVTLGAPFS